jgi:hypothetical protein
MTFDGTQIYTQNFPAHLASTLTAPFPVEKNIQELGNKEPKSP